MYLGVGKFDKGVIWDGNMGFVWGSVGERRMESYWRGKGGSGGGREMERESDNA